MKLHKCALWAYLVRGDLRIPIWGYLNCPWGCHPIWIRRCLSTPKNLESWNSNNLKFPLFLKTYKPNGAFQMLWDNQLTCYYKSPAARIHVWNLCKQMLPSITSNGSRISTIMHFSHWMTRFFFFFLVKPIGIKIQGLNLPRFFSLFSDL